MAPNQQNQENVQGNRALKWSKTLQALAVTELVLAALILFLAIVSLTIVAVNNMATYGVNNMVAYGFLTRVFGIIRGRLGVGAFRNSGRCQKCLVVSHFVMCIIAAFIDFLQIMMSAANLAYISNVHYRDTGAVQGLLAFGSIILLATVTHMVCSIVSTAFTCNNWCGGSTGGASVMYNEQKANADSGLVDIALENKQPSAPSATSMIGKWNKAV